MIASTSFRQHRHGRLAMFLLSLIVLASVFTLNVAAGANVERVMGSGSDEYAAATTRAGRSRGSSRRTPATTSASSSDEENGYDYSAYSDLLSTREEILATREHRKQRLYTMIDDMENDYENIGANQHPTMNL